MVWDPVWEAIFRENEWGKYPGEDLIRFVARNFYRVRERKDIKILEVGCGPGANLWYMAREGFSVYGIDGSETAIQKARTRLDNECKGWSGQLVVGDIGRLSFADEYFDAVIDNEAVYCNSFEDSLKIYHEMARVTKPGGKLFLRTFATGCWGDGSGEKVGHNAWLVGEGPMVGKGYVRFTDFDEIPKLLADFSIKEIELLSRSMEDRKFAVKEWLVHGEKHNSK